jgi:hypothetical protein
MIYDSSDDCNWKKTLKMRIISVSVRKDIPEESFKLRKTFFVIKSLYDKMEEVNKLSSRIAFERKNLRVRKWEIGGNQMTGGWNEIKKKQKKFVANYDVFFFKGFDPSWGI